MKKKAMKSTTRRGRKGAIKDLTPTVDPKGGSDIYLKIAEVDGDVTDASRVVLPAALKYPK